MIHIFLAASTQLHGRLTKDCAGVQMYAPCLGSSPTQSFGKRQHGVTCLTLSPEGMLKDTLHSACPLKPVTARARRMHNPRLRRIKTRFKILVIPLQAHGCS
jgi:hypothetical protein